MTRKTTKHEIRTDAAGTRAESNLRLKDVVPERDRLERVARAYMDHGGPSPNNADLDEMVVLIVAIDRTDEVGIAPDPRRKIRDQNATFICGVYLGALRRERLVEGLRAERRRADEARAKARADEAKRNELRADEAKRNELARRERALVDEAERLDATRRAAEDFNAGFAWTSTRPSERMERFGTESLAEYARRHDARRGKN